MFHSVFDLINKSVLIKVSVVSLGMCAADERVHLYIQIQIQDDQSYQFMINSSGLAQ